MTGKDARSEIELGAGPVPCQAVATIIKESGGGDVAWDEAARRIEVGFRPSPMWQSEEVTGVALRTRLAAGRASPASDAAPPWSKSS